MDRLEKEAVENFRSLSSRGSELGGLLLGSVSPGNPMTLSLTDYELITCDYSRGPLYRLSDADLARFERAIQQRLASGQGIAGFFRSQTRKGMSLDADDLTFFEQRFRDPHQIVLLVRPYATKPSTAAIFIREGGKMNGENSLLEFPFRSSELGPVKPSPDPSESAAKPAGPVAVPAASKPAARAQIVPIAPRREPALAADTPAPGAPEPTVVQAAPVVQMAPVVQAAGVAPPMAAPAPTSAKLSAVPTPVKTAVPASPAKTAASPFAAVPAVEEKTARNDKLAARNDNAVTSAAPAKFAGAEKPASAASAAVVAEVVADLEPAPRSNKMVKLAFAAAASVALFVVLFVYPGLVRNTAKLAPATAVDTSPLQLRVERTAGELLLTWNRDSDAIRNASKAVLSISDGDQHENVEMDLAQLRNGSIVYSPSGADISFKMEVTGKSQSKIASESVRVLRTRPSPLQDQAQASAQNGQAAGKPVNGMIPGAQPGTPGADGAPADTTAAQEIPVPEEPKPATQAATLKPFRAEPLSQRLRPVTTADLPEAPTAAGASAAPTAIPGVNLNAGMQAPAAPQTPVPQAPAAPVTTQPVASPALKSGGQIQQAVLIFRKDPEYPKIAKQTGAKGQVKLIATIGKDGRVKSVKAVSGHPMLQNAAADAVRQWVYKPTLLNGAAVETETEILINFMGER
jgi:protein TonB